MDDELFRQQVNSRRSIRMAKIDALPPDIRHLVHEYGYNVVNCLMEAGITKSRKIKHIVELILNEFSPTRGSYSAQGIRVNVEERTLRYPPA